MVRFKCHFCDHWIVLEEADEGAPVLCASCGVKNTVPPEVEPAPDVDTRGYWDRPAGPPPPPLLVTTTPSLEGHPVREYYGMVTGLAVLGVGLFREIAASVTDLLGGRSGSYQNELESAKTIALEEMMDEARDLGANAIVGAALDYESINVSGLGSMLMVSARGTAVSLDGLPGPASNEESHGSGENDAAA